MWQLAFFLILQVL